MRTNQNSLPNVNILYLKSFQYFYCFLIENMSEFFKFCFDIVPSKQKVVKQI